MNLLRRDLNAALVVAVAMVALPASAKGATDTVVRLDYQADEQGGCAREDELRRMVTGQLGHDPFRPDVDRQVAISIAKTEAGFEGRIVWTEADGRQVGERRFSSRSHDCHEIAANVAFAVALQLQLIDRGEWADAGADPNTTPPAATPQTGPPATTVERPSIPAGPAAVPAEPTAGRLSLTVGAGPAVTVGMAPEATALGRLFVAARFGQLSAELAADAALPVTQHEPDGTAVVVSAMGSSAAGCAHLSVMMACVLGRLGWIRARGTSVDAPSTSWGRFSEVGIRLGGTKEFDRVMFNVHADGLVMLSRWAVALNDAIVWNVPRAGIVVGVDVGLRFF